MSTIIPYGELRAETLAALIEEFVTRDGAVHGHVDAPLTEMVAAIHRQLKSGEVVIVFDEAGGSCTIMTKDQSRNGEF